jgi:FtsP/CotA-like multicopper oxidase with cupredoxin domain
MVGGVFGAFNQFASSGHMCQCADQRPLGPFKGQPSDALKPAQHARPHAVHPALPETGKVHKYDFEIARHNRAPDGLNRTLILVNGQFPGPTIEADLGDWIEVTVKNSISGPAEGWTTVCTYLELVVT